MAASQADQALSRQFASLLATHAFSNIYLIHDDISIVVSTYSTANGKSFGVNLVQLQRSGQSYWGFARLPLTGNISAFTFQPILGPARELAGFLVGEF